MPSFEEKVPSNWETMSDEFMFFNIVNSPYIHRKVLPHPMVKMNDGTSDLVVQPGWSWWRALWYALTFENGEGMFDNKGDLKWGLGLHYYKIKQWRLEPDT